MKTIKLWSTAFENNGEIPDLYTQDGHNIMPNLEWDPVVGTNSYAVLVESNQGKKIVHWLAVNIPGRKTNVGDGEVVGEEVLNSFGGYRYDGPNASDISPNYSFKVFSLDIEPYEVSIENFEEKIKGHVLGIGELKGKYTKK